jgi:hypothetical protein
MSYRFVDSFRVAAGGSGWNCSSILILLLKSCLQTCMTYTTVECTVNNSWWRTDKLSETCRVSFQNKFQKLMHLVGFIIRKFVMMHGHKNQNNTICQNKNRLQNCTWLSGKSTYVSITLTPVLNIYFLLSSVILIRHTLLNLQMLLLY